MTTIIYDAKNKQMLGEGRISQGNQVTKDDFVKVHNINGILVGAAGVVTHMLKFFDYFDKNTTAEIFQQETMGLVNIVFPETPNEDQFEALVAYPSGEVFLFEGNSSILLGQDVSFAIGSGGPYALGALESGAGGVVAMRVATKFDTMSGGEVTVVQLEEEPQELTREVAENMSKEDLLVAMFGEEEALLETSENTTIQQLESEIFYTWCDGINLLKQGNTFIFSVDRMEYTVSEDKLVGYETGELSTDHLRQICGDMGVAHYNSNTQGQLINKIFKEVKSKIPQE